MSRYKSELVLLLCFMFQVRTILLSIQSLLGEPNNDSPLNTHAAELWANQVAYKKYLLEKYERDSKAV